MGVEGSHDGAIVGYFVGTLVSIGMGIALCADANLYYDNFGTPDHKYIQYLVGAAYILGPICLPLILMGFASAVLKAIECCTDRMEEREVTVKNSSDTNETQITDAARRAQVVSAVSVGSSPREEHVGVKKDAARSSWEQVIQDRRQITDAFGEVVERPVGVAPEGCVGDLPSKWAMLIRQRKAAGDDVFAESE